MLDGKKATKSALIIMAALVTSKLFGFVREMVIAAYFGASYTTDAYLVATMVPLLLFSTVNSALNTTFIPVFSERLHKAGQEKAFHSASILLNLVFILAVLLMAGGSLLAPKIIALTAPGFDGKAYQLAIHLTRVMFPMIIFLGLTGIVSGILNSFKNFTIPALAGIPHNIIIILCVLTLGKFYGIYGLAIGTVLGVASQLFFQIPTLKKLGMKYSFSLDFRDPSIKQIGLLVLPILVGSAASQLNIIINRMLASGLPEGSISALSYADRINGIAFGIFATAIATVIYPRLSEYSAKGDMANFRQVVITGINATNMIIIPLSVGIFVLRLPLVTLLFQRGAFNLQDTQATALALQFYVIGMIALALRLIIGRIYYSLQDTRTPMILGLFSIGLNILLCLILVKYLAHGGLALATSISGLISVLLLLYFLGRKLGDIGGTKILNCLLKVAAASGIMGTIIYFFNQFIISHFTNQGGIAFQILNLAVLGLSGALIYFLCILGLRMEEVKMLKELFFKRRVKGEAD